MSSSSPLSKDLYEEIGSACRGQVYRANDPGFLDYSTIFNGNVVTAAKAVVCPLDAEDVSRVVKFCIKHSFSLSVKAGGFGTAGWSIAGDIIIDLNKITDIDIVPPHADGSFTSLKDVASDNSKGKQPQSSAANSAKRRREEDANLRIYDNASLAVASYLRGGQPLVIQDGPSPNVRRRLDGPGTSDTPRGNRNAPRPSLSLSTGSRSSASGSRSSGSQSTTSTAGTTPGASPPAGLPTSVQPPIRSLFSVSSAAGSCTDGGTNAPQDADPFGYLDESTNGQSAALRPSTHSSVSQPPVWEGEPMPPPFNFPNSFGMMDAPAQAEPIHEFAYVTFGAGKRQKEIDTYTAQHPLEAHYVSGSGEGMPYHVPFAAHPVGSSIMILGGFGFLSRLRGLSIDNLVEVEMVLADGKIVVVSENEHPDLWWAVRGAGPCLGIATRYKAKAYPIPVVFAGNLIYPFNKSTAPSLIKHFRDCVKGAPRELYANVLLTAGPEGKDSLMVVQMCYIGNREKGQEYLDAISSWDGTRCVLNEIHEKSFLHQQDSVAQVLRGKAGRQWFIRSALISSLPDDVINETVMKFAGTPVGCTWLFELAGGAISDFEDTCVPKSQREAAFTIAALHQWDIDVRDYRCVDSAEEWISGTLKPIQVGGPFPSFLGRHEAPERTKACYGDNWTRLAEIKQQYDPTNLFKNSLWPVDSQGEDVKPETHEPKSPRSLVTTLRGKDVKLFEVPLTIEEVEALDL